jgi:phosphoribosylanthranilate isomerase
MNIKVCGITTVKQLQQLEGLNIDFAGFIFDQNSPRYVGDKLAGAELQNADFDIKKVGVFVNPSYSDVLDAIDNYGLDVVQLHGEETPEFCRDINEDLEVIKVFHINESVTSIDDLVAPYDDACDYYLFDTKTNDAKGGTGKQFDWSVIAKSKIEKPFFLCGGIGVADLAKIKAFKHPDFYGVDINSKVEKAPGEKDMALVLQFKLGMK